MGPAHPQGPWLRDQLLAAQCMRDQWAFKRDRVLLGFRDRRACLTRARLWLRVRGQFELWVLLVWFRQARVAKGWCAPLHAQPRLEEKVAPDLALLLEVFCRGQPVECVFSILPAP